MKKIAFVCSQCGKLNIPRSKDKWKGFNPCKSCNSMQAVTSRGEGRTPPNLYRELSDVSGLPIKTIVEMQKRGLLPRNLADCASIHLDIACAVNLVLGSEEILRGALARFPINRREALLHAVNSDALLHRWQRHVLERYIGEYRHDLCDFTPGDKRKRYGSVVTATAGMIRHLEEQYGLPAATTRPWIRKLKKIAYNRVWRAIPLQGNNSSEKGGPSHD